MPSTVEIPYVGRVRFPDSMSGDDIAAAAARLHDEATAAITAEQKEPTIPARSPEELGLKRYQAQRANALIPPEGVPLPGEVGVRAGSPRALGAALQAAGHQFLDVPVQTVQDAFDVLGAAGLATSGPLDAEKARTARELVERPSQPPGLAAKVGAGAQRAAVSGAAAMADPVLLPAVAAGPLGAPIWMQRLLAAGFTADMARHMPEQVERFAEAYESGNPEAIAETGGDLLLTGAFLHGAGSHALTPAKVQLSRQVAKQLFAAPVQEATKFEAGAPVEARATGRPSVPPDLTKVLEYRGPVPESPATLDAQVALTAAVDSPKAATHVTPGEVMPKVPAGLVTVALPENKGTLIINPEKADPVEVAQAAMEDQHGKFLGMGSEEKPAGGDKVVQTKDEAGVVIQDEVVKTPKQMEAAALAGTQLAPGGTLDVKTPGEVLRDRLFDVERSKPLEAQRAQIQRILDMDAQRVAETGGASGVIGVRVEAKLKARLAEIERELLARRQAPEVKRVGPVLEDRLVQERVAREEAAGVKYARRPDGTLKTKEEYTPEEWDAWTGSVIDAKQAGRLPAESQQQARKAGKFGTMEEILLPRLQAKATELGTREKLLEWADKELPSFRETMPDLLKRAEAAGRLQFPPQEKKVKGDEPGQQRAGAPGVDVREPAGAGAGVAPAEQAGRPPGGEDAGGVAPGDATAGRAGPERGRGVRRGDARDPGAGGEPGAGQPAGAGAVSGAGGDLPAAGKPVAKPDPEIYDRAWKEINNPNAKSEATLDLVRQLSAAGDTNAETMLQLSRPGARGGRVDAWLKITQWADNTWSYSTHWDTEWKRGGTTWFGRFPTRQQAIIEAIKGFRADLGDWSRPYDSKGKRIKGIEDNNRVITDALTAFHEAQKAIWSQPRDPDVTPPPQAKPEGNFVLPAGEDWIPAGDKAKVRANLDAVALLKRLEQEQRPATPEEKQVLARYTGWGGLKPVFDVGKAAYRKRGYITEEQGTEYANWEKNWGKLFDEVKERLTEGEYDTARASILNAHYTSRDVINAVWRAVQRLGFTGGRALEPAGGIGHFIGLTPDALRGKTRWNAVELDDVSARILSKLYPEALTQAKGFEEAAIKPGSQDLAISNVPFAKEGPSDKRYPNFSLHNYFFARALDTVKPGGLIAFITSDSTMDSPASRKAREYIAERADLVGAIRLPNTAFKKNAGTEVTTDILFFRRKDGTPFRGEEFVRTGAAKTYKGEPVEINEYFVKHPEMMLGRMSLEGEMYGREGSRALLPTPGADLVKQLDEAIARLPEDVMGAQSAPEELAAPLVRAEAGAKLGQLVVNESGPAIVQADGTLERPEWAGQAAKVAQARSYLQVRTGAREMIAAMLDPNVSEAQLVQQRAKLNRDYDAYHKKYGAINEKRSAFLDDDVDFPLALALEDATTRLVETVRNGKKAVQRQTSYSKSRIFTERTIFPREAPTRVDTVPDALQVSLNFGGRVDLDYMSRLTGREVESIAEELRQSGQAFENPKTGQWEARSTYLSGFVKKKLAEATQAVQEDPRFAGNVKELQAVQPPAIPVENIGFRLGSTWLPPKAIEGFLKDVLDVTARVHYTEQTGNWHVQPLSGYATDRNRVTYGIHGWNGHDLVEHALNLKSPVVTRMEGAGKEAKEVKDNPKTLEAQEKQQQLQRAFRDWALKRPDVAGELERKYNDEFNGVVAPKFDAPTWAQYPGAAADITLRPHQKAVVSRILQNSTLLAHAVGTGKTFVMATAAMEMRRLGLAKKPMIVVQNSTLEQFARSFKRLYPTAKVLAPNAKQRDAQNRQKTMSRIATGDWDAVIIPQSFVNLLPDNPERVRAYVKDRLEELEKARIEAAAAEGKRSPKAADLQRAIDRLQDRLDNLKDRKQDNVLSFEDLGVDALFVDEAHEYKKLEFSTKMDNIKGLDTGASQRGFSMMMKMRHVQEKNQGRNTVFATGTPVSNTIAEAWNMMRYVRPDVLEAYHISDFDQFASTFGSTVTQLEMTPGGTWKPVTRFARYVNGPELISAWRTVADVVTPEEVNLPGLPSLKTGKTIVHTIKQTERLNNYVKFLRDKLAEFEAMSGKEKRENSHIPLVVFGLAKKATLDMRMIDPTLADEPGSKLNVAADNITRIYNDSTPVKGAQMVFSDAFQDNPAAPRFNLYQELKKKLIERGVPENEIAIITDDVKDARREALFNKVNAGELRVVIGSTQRMGVGVNAQERLIGLHHLDAPPRPMDIEQRNGRIVRQGNSNPEVEIHSYGVENTLDAAMFQKLATKQKFINQILRGDLQGRNFEDAANEVSLSFEEQMAAFSGDKRALEKVALDNLVRQLESLRSGHFEQVRKARETVGSLTERVLPHKQRELAKSQERAEAFGRSFGPEADYELELGGKSYSGRKSVAAALDAYFKAIIDAAIGQAAKAGKFGDISVAAGEGRLNGQRFTMVVKADADAKGILNPERASVEWRFDDAPAGSSRTGAGFFQSLAAVLERIEGEPGYFKQSIAGEERNVRELSSFITQPFEREAELVQAKARLAALDAELAAEAKAPAAPAAGDEGRVEHGMAAGTAPATSAGGGRGIRAATPQVTVNALQKPANAFMQDIARFRAATAPQTLGSSARFAANLLRQLNSQMANELHRADERLRPVRNSFDRTRVPNNWKYDPTLPLPRNLAFIDAYEGGRADTLGPFERQAAEEFRRQNAEWIDRVQDLGTGALQTFIENYFPHLWDNPERARSVFAGILAKRPLEGPKSFLKQRTYDLFREGLAAGLKPVHDNPVDLWLLKKREVERYIMAHKFINEAKEAGLVKFVHTFSRPPQGWAPVNDRAFTVWGPPAVTVKEAFDAGLREKTLEVLEDLGIPHERLVKIGGRRWGFESDVPGQPGSERITTKFGGPDFVLWHELGHALDNRYKDFRETLSATDVMENELRSLADLRFEGETPAPSFKRHVRTWPEKMAVAMQAYVHAPERMAEVAPSVKGAVEAFIAAHPELAKINEIRPSLRLGVGEAEMRLSGPVKLGEYYMPEAAARVMNNFLSPGLNQHLWYRSLRETSNLLNGIQLGLSAFHLGFTSLDAATSRLAVAIEDAFRGDFRRAAKTLASVPISPITNLLMGSKILREIRKPGSTDAETAELVRALEAGGGRPGQDHYWRSEFTRRMMRAIHEGTASGYLRGGLQAPFALFEQTVRPIMEYIVPRQKLGVFADMARRELERLGPDASPADVREAMRKAWDSVDNRMGQVVYDNLFYQRWVKDVALLSFRAYGWQLGKYREGIGAGIDTARALRAVSKGERPELTHRMAYAMALPIMVGTLGGITHYLFTGQVPQGADWFMPQTGETDQNGNPVRLNFPSYVKDVISYSKHPLTSFGHSLNPLLSSIADLLSNKDFYDVRIRNPDDPLWRQATDVFQFATKQFVPFSVSGAKRLREDDAPVWKQLAPFFGITPVPQRITMTPAQELASEITHAAMPREPRTREAFDRSKLIKEIVHDVKKGDRPAAAAALRGGLQSQMLNEPAVRTMIERLRYDPLQFQVHHMSAEAAMRVWRVANEQERRRLLPIVAVKLTRLAKTDAAKARLLAEELRPALPARN